MITTVNQWLSRMYAATSQHVKKDYENGRIAAMRTIFNTLFFLFTFAAFAQTEFRVDLNQNHVQTWANEVFRDCPEYASSEYVEIYKEQVKKVSMVKVADLSNRFNITDLSNVGLKSKCNPDLEYDNGDEFSPENFNPLKYFFDFNASEDRLYRVDGTNYLITISK